MKICKRYVVLWTPTLGEKEPVLFAGLSGCILFLQGLIKRKFTVITRLEIAIHFIIDKHLQLSLQVI